MSERAVLDVPVSEARADDQPTVRDHVERCELLGDVDRMEQGKQEDTRAEDQAARVRGEPRQGRDRLEVRERIGQIMLARPHRAEAHGAREPDLLDVLAEADGLRLLRQVLNGEPQAESHSGSLQTRPAAGSSVSVNWGRAM